MSIFLGTFKFFDLCQLAQSITRKASRVSRYCEICSRNMFMQSVLTFGANKLELSPFLGSVDKKYEKREKDGSLA